MDKEEILKNSIDLIAKLAEYSQVPIVSILGKLVDGLVESDLDITAEDVKKLLEK